MESSDKIQQFAASAFAVGSHSSVKSAALLFRYVMPFSFGELPSNELRPPLFKALYHLFAMQDQLLCALHLLGFDHLVERKDHIIGVDENNSPVQGKYIPAEECHTELNETFLRLIEDDAPLPPRTPSTCLLIGSTFRDLITNYNFSEVKAPVFGCDLLGGSEAEVKDIMITIANAPWIDLSVTPWEQIFEFRKDEDSVTKFRVFRRFLRNTYIGKSSAFIEDDILTSLATFEQARRKHGFELKTSVFKSFLSSKYIVGGGLSGLLAWLFGTGNTADLVGSVALATGVSVELANVILDVRSANFTMGQKIETADLGYLIKARDELQPQK